MNQQDLISSGQMAFLFFSFMTGSSIVNVPGPVIGFAQNGAWISLVITNLIGLLLLICLLMLHKKHTGSTLVECSRKAVGNLFTIVLIVPFVIYLFIMVTWIVIGVGGFMNSTMMRETPSYIFHFFILVTAAWTVRAGMEVMARMFVLYTIIIIFFVFIVLTLLLNNYHPEFLLPVLSDGVKPIILGAYFTFGFPYAEIVVFSMLISYVNKKSSSRLSTYMIAALAFNGFVLIATTICTLMTYGPLSSKLRYPLFAITRLIDFADFLQRIESVVGVTLIVSSYMKASIALFALNLMISRLFKAQDERTFIYPITLICFCLSIVMFDSQADFDEKVSLVWPLLNLTLAVIPFLIISFASFIRKEGRSRRPSS